MLAKVVRADPEKKIADIHWPVTNDPNIVTGLSDQPPPLEAKAPDPETNRNQGEYLAVKRELDQLRHEMESRLAEAHAQGHREGEAAARQSLETRVEAEIIKLRQLMREALAAGPKLRRHSEEELVRLAVAVARRVLHREITVDVDALTGLVKAAFDRIDQREIQQVRTDPGSLEILKKVVESIGAPRAVKVVADPALRAGSLIIETTRGELDASVETQLQEIQRGFIDIVHHS